MPIAGFDACSICTPPFAARFSRTLSPTPTAGNDDSGAVERLFTVTEANAAVAELRPIVERAVSHRQKLVEAQRRQAALVMQIGGNGGDLQPRDFLDAGAGIQREAAALTECVEQISDAGAQIK